MRRCLPACIMLTGTMVLAGCQAGSGPIGDEPPSVSPPARTTAPTPPTGVPPTRPSPGVSAGSPAAPTAGEWKTYRDPARRISFDLPAAWTTQLVPAPAKAPEQLTVEVRDPEGNVLATFAASHSAVGGDCPASSKRPYTVLASIPLNLPSDAVGRTAVAPRFTYRLIQGRNKFFASYGITDHAAGLDGTACLIANTVTSKELGHYMFGDVLQFSSALDGSPGLRAFDTITDAQAYMKTSEFVNLQKMITSLKIF